MFINTCISIEENCRNRSLTYWCFMNPVIGLNSDNILFPITIKVFNSYRRRISIMGYCQRRIVFRFL